MQLMEEEGIDIFGHVASVGPVNDSMFDKIAPDKSAIGQNETSFPTIDPEAAEKMVAFMTECASEGDSVGGTIECAVTGLPAGVGEPLYDSMEAVISHMMFGIPAIKGIAFGSGFACSEMKGSECNDPFIIKDGRVQTETNNSGGIQGGISNGMPVIFRVAVKPTPSIFKEQKSVNMKELTETTLSLKGRHDPCIVPRALPCVEAACAIAVYNLLCEYHKLRITQGREERSGELKELRIQIDRLDDRIAHLLAERMDVASEIGKLKAKENMPIRNVGREAEVLLHVAGIAGEEKGEYVKEVYRTLIAQTSKYEEEQ
jgi:chorismate synthase